MNTPEMLSLIAIIVALISLTVSTWSGLRAIIVGMRPVLVFEYDSDEGWVLYNIGNGPALNILVAQKRVKGGWFNPVRIPPLPKEGKFLLGWLQHVNDTGLGSCYEDFKARAYSSICGNDLSRVYNGLKLPRWNEKEIGRHWNHRIYKSDDWPAKMDKYP